MATLNTIWGRKDYKLPKKILKTIKLALTGPPRPLLRMAFEAAVGTPYLHGAVSGLCRAVESITTSRTVRYAQIVDPARPNAPYPTDSPSQDYTFTIEEIAEDDLSGSRDELEETLAAAFSKTPTPSLSVKKIPIRETSRYVLSELLMPTPVKSSLTYNVTSVQFYQQRENPSDAPTVLVFPESGSNAHMGTTVSLYLVNKGYNVLQVKKPRLRGNWLEILEAGEDVATVANENIAALIERNRQVVSLAGALDGVDKNRLGAMGISLGGFMDAYLACCDPRVKAHVVGLAGGPLPDTFVHSGESGVAKLIKKAAKGKGGTDLKAVMTSLEGRLDLDLTNLGVHADPSKILQVVAGKDTIVPAKNQYQLWEALGHPEMLSLPYGHLDIAITLPFILRNVDLFFRERLSN